MTGIKLGIVAAEASGKTTLISQLEDALVVSTDNKAFSGKVAHFRYSTYEGLENFTDTIIDKLEVYKDKYGKYPKTLVIDSVTHLANNMERWANDRFKGFDVWSNLGKDILSFNAFLEDDIIPAGINVVFTAHTQYDVDTGRYKIASPGNFGKNGSWLSVTDEAIFIEIKGAKRLLHFTTPKFPCRSFHKELVNGMNIDDFDINKHIELLESSNTESEEFRL